MRCLGDATIVRDIATCLAARAALAILTMLSAVPGSGAATPSADRSQLLPILFDVTGKDDYGTVYSVSPTGSGLRGLVGGDHAAWSPDRRNIVFVSASDGVFTVRADGTKGRRVPGTADLYSGSPRWSPDGRSVAIETDAGVTIFPIGGGRTRAVDVYGTEESPDWAPDGRLAFTAVPPGTGTPAPIYVVTRRLEDPRRLTDPGPDAADTGARWSPDGRTLLFIRSVRRRTDEGYVTRSRIYRVSSGGRPVLVRSWPGRIDSVAWSPDGRQITYSAFTRRAGDWGILDIHVYDLASRVDRVLDLSICRKYAADDGSTCANVDW